MNNKQGFEFPAFLFGIGVGAVLFAVFAPLSSRSCSDPTIAKVDIKKSMKLIPSKVPETTLKYTYSLDCKEQDLELNLPKTLEEFSKR